MNNIVVDTNVFVHSHNSENQWFGEAIDFLIRLRNSTLVLCLDEGFHALESRNRSRIWSEYIQFIPRNSLATEVLSELLSSDRVCDFQTGVPAQIGKKITQNVTDASDRVFVKVCHNSKSRSLISHDFAAFPVHVRNELHAAEIAKILSCDAEPCD